MKTNYIELRKQVVLSEDEFAEKLGFTNWSELMDYSIEVIAQGDISWFVTYQPMSGRHIAWDDAELSLDRVRKFDLRHEAEDFLIGGYADTLPEEKRFMYVLNALEDRLHRIVPRHFRAGICDRRTVSHREGHCEHVGQCVLVPVLRRFLESSEGTESLEGFIEWYSGETPTELFRAIFGREFVTADWIAEDEIPAFRVAVEAAEMEHAVIFPSRCAGCTYYGDEIPGCCGVGDGKPEPCDPGNVCSQFTENTEK